MNGCARLASWGTGALALLICTLFWQTNCIEHASAFVWLFTGSAWVLIGAWMLLRGVAAWSLWPIFMRWSLGLLALCFAWLALVQARWTGPNFLLSILVLVWAADVFAYFAGRDLGGRMGRDGGSVVGFFVLDTSGSVL
jgi:phosphatidate cytidylyltransferase